MANGRREITWDEEQRLIWVAQHGAPGASRAAVDALLRDNEPMLVALAHKVAAFTGARKVEQDMAQEGRVVLYERVFGYEFGRVPDWWAWTRFMSYAVEEERVRALLAAAADAPGADLLPHDRWFPEHVRGLRLAGLLEPSEEWVTTAAEWQRRPREKALRAISKLEKLVREVRGPRLRPARLFSYAYRKVVSAMTSTGCDALEVVRLPRSSKVHAAHRLVDAGQDPAKVAADLGVDPAVAASLIRSTLPEQESETDEHRDRPGDRMERAQEAARALERMGAEDRAALILMTAVPDPAARAALLEVEPYDLWLCERGVEDAFRRALDAAGNHDCPRAAAGVG